jgi:hypothetical protein
LNEATIQNFFSLKKSIIMKLLNTLATIFLLSIISYNGYSQSDNKPAAQGYIKDKPSNENQDKQLKDLDKQDHPEPKESPSAGSDKGNDDHSGGNDHSDGGDNGGDKGGDKGSDHGNDHDADHGSDH